MTTFALIAAWGDRGKENTGNDDGHHCECILKRAPLACQLIDTPGPRHVVVLWDPLFLILTFWVTCLSVLGLLRDLRFGASRLMNSAVFLLNGSILVGLGDHYERREFELLGYVLCGSFFVLILSVPMCGRYRPVLGIEGGEDSSSRLMADSRGNMNDEFGRGDVFSSLND